MKLRIAVCGALAAARNGVCFRPPQPRKLEAEAKVSRAEAEKIALTKAPGGTVKEGELEKEKGKLIWSFDISTPGTSDITEVHVDAITGQIAGVEKETAKAEAKEKRKEKDEDEKEEKK